MKIKSYRSFMMKLKEPEFYEVVWSVMLLGKNVYNANLFLIYNFISSYIYDKESKNYIQKENLHPHQVVFESNKKKYKFSGKRNQINRHEYKIKSHQRINKIHADLNGAFNIICKICVDFKYRPLISLDYELRGIMKNNRNKGKKISVMFSLLPTNNLTRKLVNQI